MIKPEDHNSLIEEAIRKFGICAAEYSLIRHNENITCRVTDSHGSYSLRIHCPVEGFNTSLVCGGHSSHEYMQGEVDLLIYMRMHGFPDLQKPLAGPDGRYVYLLSDGSPAMLLSWIDGTVIPKDEVARYASRLGETAALLHRASKGFMGIRCAYDEKLIDALTAELQSAARDGHLSVNAGEICARELCAIRDRIRSLRRTAGGYGIIHADLSPGNVIVTEKGLVPIDFSLSGYGCYAQEIGMIHANYTDIESRKEVSESFRQSGGYVDEADAEIFLSLSVLLFMGSQHTRFHSEQWFKDAVVRWCETLFTHRLC